MESLLTSPIEERPKLAFHIAKKEMKIIIFWFYILQTKKQKQNTTLKNQVIFFKDSYVKTY